MNILTKKKNFVYRGRKAIRKKEIGDKSARWMTKRIVVLQMLPLYALVFVCAYVRARSVL